jgi:hypothetical protein
VGSVAQAPADFADLQIKQPQHLAVAGYLWARVLVRRGINR